MIDLLSENERKILLQLARNAISEAFSQHKISSLDFSQFPPRLAEFGATFVTLTNKGSLRGCIGTLEPYQPLAEDVREHAVAAAFHDYRFFPLQQAELGEITIEVSRLTKSIALEYKDPEDLLRKITPCVDGVIFRYGSQRATFLPQVWEKLPEKKLFFAHLCQKMGGPPDLWQQKHLDVFIYQVEEFHE
jgi:AmmeMemoRadiSam system protein A